MANKSKVEQLHKDINSKFGEGSIFRGSDEKLKIEWISTGVLNIDRAMHASGGGGGFPLGKVTELYGSHGSGKTTLVLSAIKEAIDEGMVVAYFDCENSFPLDYARRNFGIEPEDILFSQEQEGEKVLDIIEAMAVSGHVDMIVIDSVAALTSNTVLKASMDDDHMAVEARMWSKFLRKDKAILNNSKTALVLINQIRENVAVMFGSPETTPGGRAIKFYSDVRMEVRKRKEFAEGKGDSKIVHGHTMRIKIRKNKVGVAGDRGFVDLYYNSGFDHAKDIVETAIKEDIIDKRGSWLSYTPLNVPEDDERIIKEQGAANFLDAIDKLENKKVMMNEIKKRVLEQEPEPYYKEEEKEEKDKKKAS